MAAQCKQSCAAAAASLILGCHVTVQGHGQRVGVAAQWPGLRLRVPGGRGGETVGDGGLRLRQAPRGVRRRRTRSLSGRA
jgi:hypothetical protein